MKKFILSISAILFSVNSYAVNLSTTGAGQVLIFPYYTVNNDINTLLNLANTTDESKALRVRFREAANSREVFAFNLYLGPHDVWTGALIKDTSNNEGVTKIISADNSCTIPDITLDGQRFYNSKFTGDMNDAYGDDANRLYEGFVEVIEMGVVTGDSAAATVMTNSVANCSVLDDAWDNNSGNPYWTVNPNTDISVPTGGILGNVVLIGVNAGISITEEATVLNNFSDEVLHFSVENNSPTLADGMTRSQINYNNIVYDFDWDFGFEAVSSVLMKNSIANEYVLLDSIGANTDWIISLPTRQFHLDAESSGNAGHNTAPFTESNNQIKCESYMVAGLYDREGLVPTQPSGNIGFPHFPMPEPAIPMLCYSTNYLSFLRSDEDSELAHGIFQSNFLVGDVNNQPESRGLLPGFQEGWIDLAFNNNIMSFGSNGTIVGLPIIGFSVQRYVNGSLGNGVLANYAGIFKHKSTRFIFSNTKSSQINSTASISADGIGQVLLFPYYTVRNNINTLISVVNTTSAAKALKVRFNEGKNGRVAMDFNLYLSPYNVWTAALVAVDSTVFGHEGEPSLMLVTHDESCTSPPINGQQFYPFVFTGAFDDGQGTNVERAQEGFFEIIEMGTVTGADEAAATPNPRYGRLADCGHINGNWAFPSGQWAIDSTVNMQAPNGIGGLYGSASLIDVAGGVDITYDATALVGYSIKLQHTDPGNLAPNLSTGSAGRSLIESDSGLMQVTWGSSIDAISSLFMQAQVSNDFVIDAGIGAETEWVNTFPTKAFYIDSIYTNSTLALPPFNVTASDGLGACEYHRFKAFNREQEMNVPASTPPILDPPPPNFSIYPEDCWSVVVSDVNKDSDNNSIFDSQLNLNDFNADNKYTSVRDLPFANGWMQIDFVDEVINPGKITGIGSNGETVEIFGKPVLGFVAQKYVNGTLEGNVLANYAVANMNKGTRKIVVSSAKKN